MGNCMLFEMPYADELAPELGLESAAQRSYGAPSVWVFYGFVKL
jgi:hypothetical protein